MLEFEGDSAMAALFDHVFKEKDAVLYLVCGAGGQVAIARKTLKDMSFTYVTNIDRIGDRKDAGGPMSGAWYCATPHCVTAA